MGHAAEAGLTSNWQRPPRFHNARRGSPCPESSVWIILTFYDRHLPLLPVVLLKPSEPVRIDGLCGNSLISTIGPGATLFLARAILGERSNAGQAIGFVLTPAGRNSNQSVERQRLFHRFGGNGERTQPARQHLRTRFAGNRPFFEALIFLEQIFFAL